MERITNKVIQTTVDKSKKNINGWEKFLIKNRDPDHPVVSTANNIIKNTKNAIDLVNKNGIPNTIEYFTDIIRTMDQLDKNMLLADKARVLTEKYPTLPKYLVLFEFMPSQASEKLYDAGYLIMNYQIDPNCYDNWEIMIKTITITK